MIYYYILSPFNLEESHLVESILGLNFLKIIILWRSSGMLFMVLVFFLLKIEDFYAELMSFTRMKLKFHEGLLMRWAFDQLIRSAFDQLFCANCELFCKFSADFLWICVLQLLDCLVISVGNSNVKSVSAVGRQHERAKVPDYLHL